LLNLASDDFCVLFFSKQRVFYKGRLFCLPEKFALPAQESGDEFPVMQKFFYPQSIEDNVYATQNIVCQFR